MKPNLKYGGILSYCRSKKVMSSRTVGTCVSIKSECFALIFFPFDCPTSSLDLHKYTSCISVQLSMSCFSYPSLSHTIYHAVFLLGAYLNIISRQLTLESSPTICTQEPTPATIRTRLRNGIQLATRRRLRTWIERTPEPARCHS